MLELGDVCARALREFDSSGNLTGGIFTLSNILPIYPGPFFGSREYDSYYWQALKHTLDIISKVVSGELYDKKYDLLFYKSSW